jgi:hexosaminidase
MRTRTYLPLILCLICAISANAQTAGGSGVAAPQHNLMPVPAAVQFNQGRLPVNKSFTVAVKGQPDARLQAGIDRFLRRIEGRTVMELPRGLASDGTSATLLVESAGPGRAVPSVEEDESYTLDVSDKQAVLKAPTTVGVLRGLETVLQLLDSDRDGYFIPSVSIRDRPRFPWRGLLIDVGRHFQPIEVLKRNLDAMAAVKLNVLHWHLTEDQGFRIESKIFPKLHEMGSDGLYYTQEQAR